MKEKLKFLQENKNDVMKVAFLAIIIIWIICFIIDYSRVRSSNKPVFCLHKETKKYPDGEVYVCTGFGYKAYYYSRKSVNATIEFGPFFLKERT